MQSGCSRDSVGAGLLGATRSVSERARSGSGRLGAASDSNATVAGRKIMSAEGAHSSVSPGCAVPATRIYELTTPPYVASIELPYCGLTCNVFFIGRGIMVKLRLAPASTVHPSDGVCTYWCHWGALRYHDSVMQVARKT